MLALVLLASVSVTIPVAGVISNATTAYSTTIRLTNRTATQQIVRADWIGRDGIGSRENAITIDLAANETRLLHSTFDLGGFPPHLGAVTFRADGAIDASAVITAIRLADLARLTQDVPGVPGAELRGAGESLVFYPVLVPGFLPPTASRPRANYGIVNDAAEPNTFVVESRFPVHGNITSNPREETVTVAAHAMVQRTLLTFGSPVDDSGVVVTIRRLGDSTSLWTGYVSSIDGATGDAMMVPPLPRGGRIPSIE